MEPLSNERGQQTLEAVLLIIVFLGFATVMSRTFQEKQLLASVTSGPWKYVQGMAEDGVWMQYPRSRAFHPNQLGRHYSVMGDPK